jgi:hypothetical protein
MTKSNNCCGPAPLTAEQQTAELARLGFADYAAAQRPTPLELQIEFELGRLSFAQYGCVLDLAGWPLPESIAATARELFAFPSRGPNA